MLTWLALFVIFFAVIFFPMLFVLKAADGRRQKLKRLFDEGDAPAPPSARVILETTPAPKRAVDEWWERVFGPPRAGAPKPAVVLTAMGVMLVVGAALGWRLRPFLGGIAVPLTALVLAALPLLYVRRTAKRYLVAFEEQLPDALEFLARSVRAGNALSISLDMLIAETANPVRAEFLRVAHDQALGASLETSLKGLRERVPLLEVRFFVAAVLLQRETGGSLSDILAKLSSSLRDRLRLKAQVRAASAQGRLTARVLSLLPLGVIVAMNVISPMYFHTMTAEPIGRMLLTSAVVSQLLGYAVMRSMINFEV